MTCQDPASALQTEPSRQSDKLEFLGEARPFDRTATAWLFGQGVRYLNSADKEGALAYERVAELLRTCNQDLIKTVDAIVHESQEAGDPMLRWNLFYILGDAGDYAAAEYLLRSALQPLPERKPEDGCEGTRDTELLVRTMAIQAIQRIAVRQPEASELLLKLITERPVQALLIEAVQATAELGHLERVREILPKEDHWILNIRKVRADELRAEPERTDGRERGFTPPKTGSLHTAPKTDCCCS